MINPPDGVAIYVFGSAIDRLAEARDIDVLFLYDRNVISAVSVYFHVDAFTTHWESIFTRPMHPAVLNKEEASEQAFLRRFCCVPFAEWLVLLKAQAT